MSPERLWAEWLDAVERGARTLEQQAAQQTLAHDVPQQTPTTPAAGTAAPATSPPPMPAVPWPTSLDERGREVLATLAAATRTVERCRDETGAALSRLAHAPVRGARSAYADGACVDVLG